MIKESAICGIQLQSVYGFLPRFMLCGSAKTLKSGTERQRDFGLSPPRQFQQSHSRLTLLHQHLISGFQAEPRQFWQQTPLASRLICPHETPAIKCKCKTLLGELQELFCGMILVP